jgi:hypothetical protein
MVKRVAIALVMVAGCRETKAAPPEPVAPVVVSSAVAPTPPVRAVYPWHPTATERLDVRFAAPTGFARVTTEEGSFGDFLRTLPLLPDGAPVVDYRGAKLHDEGHHPSIAAVADLDIGDKNLQHCADVIIRLDAEWRYSRGKRDMAYHSVSGARLAYDGWVLGDRGGMVDGKFVVRRVAPASKETHALFRGWMDDVFSWAGTASLEHEGKHVELPEIRGGDFFVMSGSPFGHAVIVLDVAKANDGRVALLLGQSYMPAQSFQILRPSKDTAWFVLDADAREIATPFWKPFPMSTLRRFS